jgi:glyoxylase-like metal-dependent hydrolase (beta-lactamase superfamily II)
VSALQFPHGSPPPPGARRAVTPDVDWVRLPVPGPLQHINVWLLRDPDGWTLVDTGMSVPQARDAWRGPLAAAFREAPLRRILCTHHHPDHAGLAHWLSEAHGAPVLMSAPEDAVMRRIEAVWHEPERRAEHLAWWAATGVEMGPAQTPYLTLLGYRSVVSGRPSISAYLADGSTLSAGGCRYQCRLFAGHSDAQAVLIDGSGGLLIAGDQLLPTISSNVGAYPERADPNPLASYLDSLSVLESLASDLLVLPSHGLPFYGLRPRVAELRAHHAQTLERLAGSLPTPHSAAAAARLLFPGAVDGLNRLLAVGETLAHLIYLERDGRVAVEDCDDGIRRYRGRAS